MNAIFILTLAKEAFQSSTLLFTDHSLVGSGVSNVNFSICTLGDFRQSLTLVLWGPKKVHGEKPKLHACHGSRGFCSC